MYFIYFEHRNKKELVGHADDVRAAQALLTTLATQFIARNEGEPKADARWIEDNTPETLGFWIKREKSNIILYSLIEEEVKGLIWSSTTDTLKKVGSWHILEHDLSLTNPFKELLEARDQLNILKKETIEAHKDALKWKEKYQSRAGAKIAEVYDHEPDTSVEDLAKHFKKKIPEKTKDHVFLLSSMVRKSLAENEKYKQMRRKCDQHTVGDV